MSRALDKQRISQYQTAWSRTRIALRPRPPLISMGGELQTGVRTMPWLEQHNTNTYTHCQQLIHIQFVSETKARSIAGLDFSFGLLKT